MKIIRTLASLLVAGGLLAGCGHRAVDTQTVSRGVESTTPTTAAVTTTTIPPTTTTTVDPRIVVRDVTTSDGWSYRISIIPTGPDASPTADRCVEVAAPGTTNLGWAMTVENLLVDRPAPWPGVVFGMNLNEAGTAVDPRATNILKSSFHGVDVAPNEMTMCFLRNSVFGGSGNQEKLIPASSSVEFTITAGPVAQPVPGGTHLLVDFFDGRGVASIPAA